MTRLHQGRFTTYSTEHGLPDNTVSSLGGDGQGNPLMFFGFHALRWMEGKFQSADDLRLTGNRAPSDQAQHLPWFIDDTGKVACFVDGQLRFWTAADFQSRFPNGLPAQDHTGMTWFSSNAGLLRVENGRAVKTQQQRDGLPGNQPHLVYGQQHLQAFSRREGGSLWLTDLDSMQSHLVAQQPPEGLEIYVSYGDREGNYWFGTLRNGLYRARKQSVTAYSTPQGLNAVEVYPICEDRDGAIWIGTAGNGLFRFKDGVFTNYSGVPNSFGTHVNSLYQDRAGRLWVNGAWRFEGGRFAHMISPEALPASLQLVWTMHEDRAGALWFGTEKGVVRY